jgi:hypothetical protein
VVRVELAGVAEHRVALVEQLLLVVAGGVAVGVEAVEGVRPGGPRLLEDHLDLLAVRRDDLLPEVVVRRLRRRGLHVVRIGAHVARGAEREHGGEEPDRRADHRT